MIIRILQPSTNVNVQPRLTRVVRVYNTRIPSGITTDLLTAAGQLIVCLSPGVAAVIAPPTANGQTLVSDLTVAGLWRIGSTGGAGGVIELTNKDTEQAVVGSVVIPDLSNDKAFLGTAIPNHLGAIGVTAEVIAINATGKIAIAALADVLVSGNVARGEWLATSATKWRAKTAGYDKPLYGAVGYALTAYGGGANGSVQAVVMPEPKHLSGAGTAWAIGGINSANVTDAQKFTIASAIWAVVAGAAITTATRGIAGLGYGTIAGYSIGGYTTGYVTTAYKTPFATEVTATQSSADLPLARYGVRGGLNGASKGYIAGGDNAGAANTVTKLTYATDTMSAALGTTLSQARLFDAGVSNGSLAYVQGGYTGTADTGVSDLITLATDSVSDNNSGDVTADKYSGISFAADNGYTVQRSGAINNSKKITLATGVSANVTSTLPADQLHAAGISNGNGLGWFSGDDASPYSVSTKFTKATELYAADAGAVMSVGKNQAAVFNNGAL